MNKKAMPHAVLIVILIIVGLLIYMKGCVVIKQPVEEQNTQTQSFLSNL